MLCASGAEERRSLSVPVAIPCTDKANPHNCRTSKGGESSHSSPPIKLQPEEAKWISDEVSSLHGTHTDSYLTEDEENPANACFECQSARVRLRVP